MKVLYEEDLTSHFDPESCGGAREGTAEALTGGNASRVLSPEKHNVQGASAVKVSEGQHRVERIGELDRTLRGRRPRARIRSLPCGNREILDLAGRRWPTGPRRKPRWVRLR